MYTYKYLFVEQEIEFENESQYLNGCGWILTIFRDQIRIKPRIVLWYVFKDKMKFEFVHSRWQKFTWACLGELKCRCSSHKIFWEICKPVFISHSECFESKKGDSVFWATCIAVFISHLEWMARKTKRRCPTGIDDSLIQMNRMRSAEQRVDKHTYTSGAISWPIVLPLRSAQVDRFTYLAEQTTDNSPVSHNECFIVQNLLTCRLSCALPQSRHIDIR
jgi:hypothetical protein